MASRPGPRGQKPDKVWVAKTIAKWQDRFGLGGWRICHVWKRYAELDNGGRFAQIIYHYKTAFAKIDILDVGDFDSFWETNGWGVAGDTYYEVYEAGIVHELLHLVCCGWDPSKGSKVADMERAIETIARVIVLGRVGN
jgi:hypothetical protein